MPRLCTLALALALSGSAAAQEPVTVFFGEALYRERVALPPEAEIVVALKETVDGIPDAVVASAGEPTRGKQVPLAFRLEVPHARLIPDSRYALEIAIRLSEGLRWLSEPVAVEPSGEPVYVGSVLLRAHRPVAFATMFRCGDVTVRFGADDDGALLAVAGRTFSMAHTPAASGARYEARENPATVFWSRGEEAMLTLAGEEFPVCRLVAEPVSGRAVLPGVEWVVEAIAGQPAAINGAAATLRFTEEGRLAGRASCNRYVARYAVNGARLAVDPRIAVTQMACPDPVMEQERRFLDALAEARAFRMVDDMLVIEGGAVIRARRAGTVE